MRRIRHVDPARSIQSNARGVPEPPRPSRRPLPSKDDPSGPAHVVDPHDPVVARVCDIRTRTQQRRTTGELARFRAMLEAERARLIAQLQALTSRAREVGRLGGFDAADPSDEDIGDVVSMLFERERELVLESTVQHMLQQVEEAFARFEAGTYGNCKRCGRPIGSARLRVLPSATLCVRRTAQGIGGRHQAVRLRATSGEAAQTMSDAQ